MYDDSLYFRVCRKMDSFIEDVAQYYNVDVHELKHYHYVKYCEEVLGYEFHPMIVGKHSRNKLWANITFVDDFAIILYNKSTNNRGRVHYSISHEISHAVLEHHKNGTQVFAEMVDAGNYSEDERIIEYEANIGASLLMLNDKALEKCIEYDLTFFSICNKFQMSYKALEVRLYNYFKFNYECRDYLANRIAESFRRGEITLSEAINGELYFI